VTLIKKEETGCSNKHDKKDSDAEKKPPLASPHKCSTRAQGTAAQVIPV
jgi:hypothetical protein